MNAIDLEAKNRPARKRNSHHLAWYLTSDILGVRAVSNAIKT